MTAGGDQVLLMHEGMRCGAAYDLIAERATHHDVQDVRNDYRARSRRCDLLQLTRVDWDPAPDYWRKPCSP